MNAEPICATRDWETRKHAENPMLDRRLKKKKTCKKTCNKKAQRSTGTR